MFAERGWINKRAAHSSGQIALIDLYTNKGWTYSELNQKIQQ